MMIIIETVCPICGKHSFVEVKFNDYVAYREGALAKEAFPYLSLEDREKIISGFCETCWL